MQPSSRVIEDAGRHSELRVLAIVPSPACFGLQNLTLAVFGCLSPRLKPHFLTTRWTDGEFNRRLAALGIPYSATWFGMFSRKFDWLNLRMTLECLLKLPTSWRDFFKLYRSFRPDVIYFANHHEIILLWPLLIFMRKRVVCHMHDPPPPILFQKLSFFCWRRAVGRFLCISNNTRERLARLGPLKSESVVVHNGVEISPLSSTAKRSDRFVRQFGWPASVTIFGISGQMAPEKGHEDFLAAATDVGDHFPEARFVIGGRQQGAFYESLERLVDNCGMRSLVGFCGWLPSFRDFAEAIDVFVLPSRHDEGFGLVVAEAGERGVPIVATKSGGAIEIVSDGVTGLLVDKQNPSALAGAMTKLIRRAELRSAFGKSARLRVCQLFSLIVQVSKIESFLREGPLGRGKTFR